MASLLYHRRKYRAEQKAKRHQNSLKRIHRGMSPEEFQARYDAQGGMCPIGGHKMDPVGTSRGGNSPVFDHSHKTGLGRGIICSRHNAGLGAFQDSPEVLESAAAYLRAAAKKRTGSQCHLYYDPVTNSLDKKLGPC